MRAMGLGDVLPAALAAQERGESAVIVTVLANNERKIVAPGSRLLVREQGQHEGTIHPDLDALLVADALTALQGKRSVVRSYIFGPGTAECVGVQGGDIDVFFEVLRRPPRLLIVGGGHIAAPLARVAKLLDFEVSVLDDRPEYANRERFPDVDQLLVGPYRETFAGVRIHGDTYIVLITRGHVHDQACLELALDSDAAYIGMIGSKRRVRTVMAHLKAKGFDVEKLKAVHAPIGLDIAAETPGEIAVAIMAEIINVRRGGRAGSLALGERLRV